MEDLCSANIAGGLRLPNLVAGSGDKLYYVYRSISEQTQIIIAKNLTSATLKVYMTEFF